MVLDPTFKLAFWKEHAAFMLKHYNISVNHVYKTFCTITIDYEKSLPQKNESNAQATPSALKTKKKSFFATSLYETVASLDGIQSEIACYLKEDPEPEGIKILDYWSSCQQTFPKLSMMAQQFLAIPAQAPHLSMFLQRANGSFLGSN
jgi:hypothetical protein